MQPMIFILFLVVAYCLHISINHQPSITSIDPYHNVVTTTASSDSLVERNSAYSIASQLNNLPLEDKTWQGEIQNQIRDGEYK
jgi:hypothetical protein